MRIKIGDVAPNFTQTSTAGPIDFYKWAEGKWTVLFSHPKDFTPVCTTELGTVARLKGEFDKRNVKVLGLSVDAVSDHHSWAKDIAETQGAERNFEEILRVIDSLQLTDKYKVATPADWKQGEDVIIVPALKDEQEIKRLFPQGYKTLKPYLRLTPQPNLVLRFIAAVLTGTFFSLGTIHAEEAPQQTVEQRLSILERKYEIDKEEAAAKQKDGSGVSAKGGFSIKTNDNASTIKISGVIQTDYRDFLGDGAALTDQFLLRRIRPTISGTVNKVVDFRITPEFASAFQLLDAYGELKTFKWFKARAGKFKPPVGLERLQSGASILFVERAHPTSLVPNRDAGLQISGDSEKGTFSYQIAVLNGVVDGGSGETDTSDGKDYVARIFTHPFKSSIGFLSGLGVGVAASIGDQLGTAASSQLPTFRTNSQQTFFTYAAGSFANGERTRVVPQAYWYSGSIGLLGEYARSSQEVTRVTTTTINNTAWQIAGSWVLTGEKASFNGVKPKKAFDPKNGGWGAFELTARYSELKVDDRAFVGSAATRFANPATAAKRNRGYTGGFNWYLNDNTKLVSNYEYTTFDGGASSAGRVIDRNHERAVFSRLQFTY